MCDLCGKAEELVEDAYGTWYCEECADREGVALCEVCSWYVPGWELNDEGLCEDCR